MTWTRIRAGRCAMLSVLMMAIGCAAPASDQSDGAKADVVVRRWEGRFTTGEAAVNELTVSASGAEWRQWVDREGVIPCVVSLPPQESSDRAYRNLVWSCPRSQTPSNKNALEYRSASDTWILTDGEGRLADRFSFHRATPDNATAANAGASSSPLQPGADSMPANAYGSFRGNSEQLVVRLDGLHTIDEGLQIDPLLASRLGPPKDIGKTVCTLDGSVRRWTPDSVTMATAVFTGWKRCRYGDGDTGEWPIEMQYVPSGDGWVLFYDSRPGERWTYRRTGASMVADVGANLIDLLPTAPPLTVSARKSCGDTITASLDSILTANICPGGYGITASGDTVHVSGGWVVGGEDGQAAFLMENYRTMGGRYLATLKVTGKRSDGSVSTAVLHHTKIPDRGELYSGDIGICTRQGLPDPLLVVLAGGRNKAGGQIVNAAWLIQKLTGVLVPIRTDGVVCES